MRALPTVLTMLLLGSAANADEPATEAANVAAGRLVYMTYCIACHQLDGTGMNGRLAADFVNDPTRLVKSDEILLASIAKGVPGTSMPAWGATVEPSRRKSVLAFIRAEFGKKEP